MAYLIYHSRDQFAIYFSESRAEKSEIYLPFIIFKRKVLIIMAKTTVKTGQFAPKSGQYRPVGSKTEVTLVQGKRVPPTPQGATKFTLVDATKHKGGGK